MEAVSISLSDFVLKNGGNESSAEDIASLFFKPPAFEHWSENAYTSKHYDADKKEQMLAGPITALGHKVLVDLMRPKGHNQMFVSAKLFGFKLQSLNNIEGQLFLMVRAAFHRFTGRGACSFRASLAAIELRKVLPEGRVKIWLKSEPSKDQFVVMLKVKKGWFVYDPLTNPECIFPHSTYASKVITLFPDAPDNKRLGMKVKVDTRLAEQFEENWSIVQGVMSGIVKEKTPTAHELKEDRIFRECLSRNGIKRAEINLKYYEKLLRIFQKELAAQEPEPEAES